MQFSEEDIFWVSHASPKVYSSISPIDVAYARKFLGYLLPDGKCFIIVGTDDTHIDMLRRFERMSLSTTEAEAKRLNGYVSAVDLEKPVVAGDLMQTILFSDEIYVSSWSSTGLEVETPEGCRERLRELLEREFEIELN